MILKKRRKDILFSLFFFSVLHQNIFTRGRNSEVLSYPNDDRTVPIAQIKGPSLFLPPLGHLEQGSLFSINRSVSNKCSTVFMCLRLEATAKVFEMLASQSCPLFVTPWKPARLLCPWNSPGRNTGVGCRSLLQGIFLTQGLNTGLMHCT